ncbi:type II toxin-antitoxin system TacA family antitoxin [Serratia marcescens]|uniref:type II toxin-antitoxin system TacA family antitoxin n=1 Tax=Serratia marcescens TaxID=615 RepID=UPI001E393F5A|nr:DUF1778 domain-containing protein [Serratia marcescens]
MANVAVVPANVKSFKSTNVASLSTDAGKGFKDARVELKTTANLKDVLREAASAAGLDLTAFILNAALERAESVLDNQRRRQLSEQSWHQVNQLLSEPAAPTLALQALMRRKKNGESQQCK